MKLMHLADLHLGKRVNGFSMIEDQKYILDQIIKAVQEEKPEAVLIAGDVYDRGIPSEEAVELFDEFLVQLIGCRTEVFMISGNHDSAERVAFGGRLMDEQGLHIAPVYDGTICPISRKDEVTGDIVDFWMIPFLKPANVHRFAPDAEIETYEEAMRLVVEGLALDSSHKNVALVHQFITGASVCDSEEISHVGGIDQISASVFDAFDYVALGHLHGPQKIKREGVRYAGSPLKYSFSEANQKKSVTMIELGSGEESGHHEQGIPDQKLLSESGKGLTVHLLPLHPLRDMVQIGGTFEEMMSRTDKLYDYCEITLVDEEDVPNAMGRLRALYPNLMVLHYDNTRTRTQSQIESSAAVEKKSPLELFDELYQRQNGREMDEDQISYMTELIRMIEEGQE